MFVRRGNKFSGRGDTLIEVLFAVAIFSLVAVGSLSIMNQGTASAERSLEITLVRQQIDAQAETLRYLNASYIANGSGIDQWLKIQTLANKNSSASTFGGSPCATMIPGSGVFALNTHAAKYVDPTDKKPGPTTAAYPFSQVVYDSGNTNTVSSIQGIWIQPVRYKGPDSVGYIDFHIRACWDSPGQSAPMTLGTIVRLYEPQ